MGRTTTIIPEGWNGSGFRRFYLALLDQHILMNDFTKEDHDLDLEELGPFVVCVNYMVSFLVPFESISSLLFNMDLHNFGYLSNTDIRFISLLTVADPGNFLMETIEKQCNHEVGFQDFSQGCITVGTEVMDIYIFTWYC
ncbi:unnamed protein product [Cuscuta epithymum]|uniref:Uncharacterized protein n=1 Tax=Cuscuta epithymum TaxID=186058 RepID=A0AAV0D4W7_9ASTE|nr:unnamed protein product [Cuscuta epithymum]